MRAAVVAGAVVRRWREQAAWARRLVCLGSVVVAVAVPPALPPFGQSVLFFPIAVYVLLALGLNIVVSAGLLDLGYVAFFAVGAYSTALLTTSAGWDPWAALPVAVSLAMVAGVVLGAPTLRLRGDYLAIVTLGFGEIVRIIAQNSEALGEARGITGIPNPTDVAGLDFGLAPLPYYYLTLVAIALVIATYLRLSRSRVGRAWSAIREDEDAAEAMGVPTYTMKLWAFAVGASTAGMAGWLYASKASFISPDTFPFFFSVLILSAVVLGGMGSVPGVMLGGFAIAFLPEYLRNAAAGEFLLRWLNTVTGGEVTDIVQYRTLLFGATLVVVMVFRPQGLLPARRRAARPAPAGDTGRDAPPVATPTESEPATELVPAVTGTDAVLELREVTMAFGGVVAMRRMSLVVRRGQIFGIIGPNGAGKTTLFNCVTGVFRPSSGDIMVNGRSVVGRQPHRITAAGVARTFQNIR
ncbi:MAG: ABC transporter permease subunit, partial [Acidimicrobiales bacterium]